METRVLFRKGIGLCLIGFSLVFVVSVILKLPLGSDIYGWYSPPPDYYKIWLLFGICVLVVGFLVLTAAFRGFGVVIAGILTVLGALMTAHSAIANRVNELVLGFVLMIFVLVILGLAMALTDLGSGRRDL